VCFAYFLYFAVACWYPKLPWRRRVVLSATALTVAAAIRAGSAALPPFVHDWAPLAWISIGYYISGWLFAAPSARLEAWLLAWDHRLFGDPTTRFARWPRWLSAYLDLVYTICFLLLPAGLVALIAGGHVDRADHYWTLVAAADLGAFAPLAVFQTRPPWQIEPAAVVASPGAHRVASFLVRNATIGVNTFPSGHVAVTLAIALAVIPVMPFTGAVLFALAVTTAIACVAGRFHYAIDAVTGAAWGLLVCVVVTACGA
jgi:membrane-associated phospholipid phosphatase